MNIMANFNTFVPFLKAAAHLIVKIFDHDDEIEELYSRLEECEEKHESSELKK